MKLWKEEKKEDLINIIFIQSQSLKVNLLV